MTRDDALLRFTSALAAGLNAGFGAAEMADGIMDILETRFDMGRDDTPHKDSASVRACKLALACIETGGIHPITPDGQNLRRILREAAGLPVEKGTP